MDDLSNVNMDIEIHDFLDLINETLKESFREKWRYKYSEKLLKAFQLQLLNAFQKSKPIKLEKLTKYFTENHRYSIEYIMNFYNDIEVELYNPVIINRRKQKKTKF